MDIEITKIEFSNLINETIENAEIVDRRADNKALHLGLGMQLKHLELIRDVSFIDIELALKYYNEYNEFILKLSNIELSCNLKYKE